MSLKENDRIEEDRAEAIEDKYWANKQAKCDHEYEITNEIPVFDYWNVRFEAECTYCGKKSYKLYVFSEWEYR